MLWNKSFPEEIQHVWQTIKDRNHQNTNDKPKSFKFTYRKMDEGLLTRAEMTHRDTPSKPTPTWWEPGTYCTSEDYSMGWRVSFPTAQD